MKLIATLGLLTLALGADGSDPALRLFSDFDRGWKAAWRERSLSNRDNDFFVEEREGQRHLRVESTNSASALWRPVDADATGTPLLSWRWKVAHSLSSIANQRRRPGDDYAARVAVMFDGPAFERRTPVVMYVWAGSEPRGSVYPSPYSDNIATVVLRSGDRERGRWLREERDIVADFESFFGKQPRQITAVAVMVDTDNTSSSVTTWFDDLRLTTVRPPHQLD